MSRITIIKKILKFRNKYLSDRSIILILSVIIGIIAGLLALVFKTTVFHLRDFIINNFNLYTFWIYPLVGISITVLFKEFLLKDHIKHNIASILHAISKRNSLMKNHKMYSSIISAILTAGFGGSIGLESPIISSGAAVGSNIGRLLRFDYKRITLLLACGAAGAISAIFNTPIAGIVFAFEVLLIDLSRFTLIPLLLSAISGALTTVLLLEEEIFLEFTISQPFMIEDTLFYILIGIIAGIVSFYFTKAFLKTEEKLEKIKDHKYRTLIGGLALGAMIFLFPALYGEGYDIIKSLLNNEASAVFQNSIFSGFANYWIVFVGFFLAMILIKVIATATTIGSGGVGGIFAPSLFTGAILGFLFAFVVNSINPNFNLSENNFALVGMASVLGGVLQAPLTGIFLIAEITKGYELFIPLMLSTTIAYVTAKKLSPNSIITTHLVQRGELITHHKDKAVLSFMQLKSVIETDFLTVHADSKLGNLVKIISKSHRNIYPVTDEHNYLLGVVLLDDVREIMFNKEMYDTTDVLNLMIIPPEYIFMTDNMEQVIKKFNETNAWNLPVVENQKYVGFVSKSKLFNAYRKWLIELTEE